MSHKAPNSPAKPSRDTDAIRVPPHNDEAERSVLGAVIIDNRSWAAVCRTGIAVESFYRPSHRHIWAAICTLSERGAPIDVLTLCDELVEHGHYDAVGGHPVIARLSSEVPSAANVQYYCEIVVSNAHRRRAIQEGLKIVDAIYEREPGASAPGEIATALIALARSIQPPDQAQATVGGAQLGSALAQYEAAQMGEGSGGVSTGIAELDRMIGGLFASRSVYVGGLSKMGKTSLMISIAGHAALNQGWAVEFLSCEMGAGELMARFVGWASGVPPKRLFAARRMQARIAAGHGLPLDTPHRFDVDLLDDWEKRWAEAVARIEASKLRLTLHPQPVARAFALQVESRQLQLEAAGDDPRRLIAIADYLQRFRSGDRKVDADETTRIAAVSPVLSGIAQTLNIPVLIPFQFGREAENRFQQSGKMPDFNDARGSSQIANDANEMIVYHRPFWRDEDSDRAGYVRIRSALSRDGAGCQMIHLGVDLTRSRYTTWTGEQWDDEAIERMAAQAGGAAKNAWQAKNSFRQNT